MPRFISQVLAVGLTLSLAIPASASAQFGSLVKKARKATHTESAATPVAGGPELTEQSVQGLLRALPLIQNMTQTRGSLVARQQTASREYSSLMEQHGAENAAYNKSTQDVGNCRDDAFSKINDAHQKAAEAKQANLMNDPAAMQQYMALARESAALQAKGDTKGAIALSQQFQAKMLGINPKADSAQVDKACGKVPAKPAWLARADSLSTLANTLSDSVRSIENRMGTEGSRASGMDIVAYNVAFERLTTWYHAPNGNGNLSKTEYALLDSHKQQLEQYAGIFR
ncbi:MAG TPA: hypothetical protein VFW89_01920 [Gemmatimonadaceae bacterium]|nr:hypothetical protein [Gemmatimonadaceae bacterium]